MTAADVLPTDSDLPGVGWLAIDDGIADEGGGGPGALFDCVGPAFPDAAVVDSASSPHYVRPPGALVHGLGVGFDSDEAADTAEAILASSEFATCLGRSVGADLEAGATDAELLDVEVVSTSLGHRVRFTGGDGGGVRSVHLDIVVVRSHRSVGVLWCGDTGGPFPDADARHLIDRVGRRPTS